MPYHWTQVVNIKRDPFETSIGEQAKTLLGMGGALGGPVTAYIYDWNMLPIGQALWLKELSSYIDYPPMQDPASYNLDQVMDQVPGDEIGGCERLARDLVRGRPQAPVDEGPAGRAGRSAMAPPSTQIRYPTRKLTASVPRSLDTSFAKMGVGT